MNKLARIIGLCIALLFSGLACQLVTEGINIEGININAVRGSGNVVTEERQVEGFTRVDLASIGELNIELGENEALRIEAEENLLQYIETEIQGDTLVIGTQPGVNINPREPIRYHLTVESLEGVELSGLGDINVPSVEASSFDTDISGGGDINIVSLQSDDLTVDISGLGNLTIEDGQVAEQMILISGGGNYTARDLASERAQVTISGLGSATIRVSEHLEANVSGGGSVRYIGNPTVDENISGLGDVEQIDE